MRVLEYSGLDTSRVAEPYRRVAEALSRGDFRAADAKKLVNLPHGKFYGAKLGHADRLLFCLVRHGDEVCVLALEVIEHHAYERSRFLRGAAVDESKIVETSASEAAAEARPERNRRQHLSAVLSRNEVDRDYAWNRALFRRLRQGWYQLNPALAIRARSGAEESWRPIFAALNLPLANELTPDRHWPWVEQLSALTRMPPPAVPVAAERLAAKERALRERMDALRTQQLAERYQRAELRTARQAAPVPGTASLPAQLPEPKWGTPEARERELMRLRQRLEESRKARKG